MNRISIDIDDSFKAQLDTFALEHHLSSSAVLKKALEVYLEDYYDFEKGSKALEEFYQTKGETYSLEEVKKMYGL
jgi:predicted DNA-binding protein